MRARVHVWVLGECFNTVGAFELSTSALWSAHCREGVCARVGAGVRACMCVCERGRLLYVYGKEVLPPASPAPHPPALPQETVATTVPRHTSPAP